MTGTPYSCKPCPVPDDEDQQSDGGCSPGEFPLSLLEPIIEIEEGITILSVCSPNKGPWYYCSFCCIAFPHEQQLNAHLEKCGVNKHRRIRCLLCDKIFKSTANIRRHQVVHTGERPYPCDVCGKSFSQKYSVVIHKRLHTGKPYGCDHCSKSFTRKTNLQRHSVSHSGEKPFRCKLCDSSFTQRAQLLRHFNTQKHRLGGQEASNWQIRALEAVKQFN